MSRPRIDYTLVVREPDESGRITITSPEVPGLLIWAFEKEALADVPEAVRILRHLNRGALQSKGTNT